jgi:hypothetical protein
MYIDRRSFCIGTAAALLAGCGSLNGFYCTGALPYGTRVYPVRLRRFERLVDQGKIEEQSSPEWCWAAAIHAILVFHGVRVSQEQVFDRVKGKVSSGPSTGTVREIIRGLSGGSSSWFLNNGDSRAIVADLHAGNPVLVGLRPSGADTGHVVVVYGVTYVMNLMNGATFVDNVEIWDPAEGLTEMLACDFKPQMVFALHSWRPRG